MPSRNAYTALTPDFATSSFPTHSISGISEDDQVNETQSLWCAALSAATAVANNNAGLLLVTASQVFFSLMNFSVKILNTIDPPVSTLQVCSSMIGTHVLMILIIRLSLFEW